MRSNQHIDHLLAQWNYDPDEAVRLIKGGDGRSVIQVRVDMGVLQLEIAGRPDGTKPEGHETLLHFLIQQEMKDPDLELDDDLCDEIDREFVQFYHRRIAWLKLQKFTSAISDADHTLALMDFCKEHSPDEEWTLQHEQHRAFVLFHRTQAAALVAIENKDFEQALHVIDAGLSQMRQSFDELGWEEHFDSDELVQRLQELRESLAKDASNLPKSLQQQLEEAVRAEQYELAAILRDQLAKQQS